MLAIANGFIITNNPTTPLITPYIKLNENMVYYVIDGYASGISLY